MKKIPGFLILTLTATVAWLAGRWSSSSTVSTPPSAPRLVTMAPAPPPGSGKIRGGTPSSKTDPNATNPNPDVVTAAQALLMTSEERIAHVKKGALLFDSAKQTDFLCGVISVLTKPELDEATKALGTAQDRGNFAAQTVWDSIWKQWGKVDAAKCLEGLGAKPEGKPVSDAKNVMKGWLETDPAAAMAWARQPRENSQEAAAAAHALGVHAAGNLEVFSASIAALPPGSQTVKACLHDYFDTAMLAQASPDAAAVYAKMPDALRAEAWSVTMQRISYTDPQTAVNWLVEHVNDPGRDYQQAGRLVYELAGEDPASATEWAARLPEDSPGPDGQAGFHPVSIAFNRWRRQDPTAAASWLQSQPPDKGWISQLQQQVNRSTRR